MGAPQSLASPSLAARFTLEAQEEKEASERRGLGNMPVFITVSDPIKDREMRQ